MGCAQGGAALGVGPSRPGDRGDHGVEQGRGASGAPLPRLTSDIPSAAPFRFPPAVPQDVPPCPGYRRPHALEASYIRHLDARKV